MLNFFRRIRKGLLDGGRTSKYLLYAIGEIALVVIGILIALQINNWNEWRKDRIKEQEVLRELSVNIQFNIDFIKQALEFDSVSSNSCKIMLDAIKEKRPWHDTLTSHVRKALNTTIPTISFSAYESLKSRGIDIIVSNSLRNEIANLYETNYDELVTVITRMVNIELKPNVARFSFDNLERFDFSGGGGRYIPNEYETFLENEKYLNLLSQIQGLRVNLFRHLLTKVLQKVSGSSNLSRMN